MSKQPSDKQPWSFDLNLREGDAGYDVLQKVATPFKVNKALSLEKQSLNSHGMSSGADKGGSSTAALALMAKKRQKAMEVALAPGKQIFMNAFMMYMSGKTLNIFSISVTSMALMNPIKSLVSINQTFKPFEDSDNPGKSDLQMPKLLFVVCNFIWFCVGLYKMGSMRLLPTTSADWSGTVVWKEMLQISSIPSI